jgi:putative membrane protein
MMFWYCGHWAFWEVALMWVGMITFSGLIIWVVSVLVTNARRGPENDLRGDDARRILDQRLARAEIDAEEYRRLRELLAGEERTPVGSGGRQ